MTSPLSGIAVGKRRQLAATLGLLAMLFLAVGAVTATTPANAVTTTCLVIALLVAVVLALMAWGVVRSIRLDQADSRLDAAIEEAMRAGGRSMCDCGHEHDPDELHFVDGEGQHLTGHRTATACAHDGTGTDCTHNCDTCVLASMRLEPAAAFERPGARPRHAVPAATEPPAEARRRPQPGPRRPSPAAER